MLHQLTSRPKNGPDHFLFTKLDVVLRAIRRILISQPFTKPNCVFGSSKSYCFVKLSVTICNHFSFGCTFAILIELLLCHH